MLDSLIRWADRVQSSSSAWSGNLFDFFFRIYPMLVKDLKIPFKLEGITRIDDTPAHKALREALANYDNRIFRIKCEEERRIFTPVARDSYKWKRLYKKRTGVGRFWIETLAAKMIQ